MGDVAQVVIGSPPPIGDAIINDVPGILLIVEKQPEENTLEVTRKVEAALDALPRLEKCGSRFNDLSPRFSLLMGCGLVVVILVIFLYD